ncbi:hypothetical protein GE21DRAFT_1198658 [Neurospora crassa]|nr:hypothetical protein 68B2.70 [imported] - Neurospora crassa [Neurospora crassa]KHE88891.1 hypothetical protein GE21DRAFT_1198658 [Neurospora crassa]
MLFAQKLGGWGRTGAGQISQGLQGWLSYLVVCVGSVVLAWLAGDRQLPLDSVGWEPRKSQAGTSGRFGSVWQNGHRSPLHHLTLPILSRSPPLFATQFHPLRSTHTNRTSVLVYRFIISCYHRARSSQACISMVNHDVVMWYLSTYLFHTQ